MVTDITITKRKLHKRQLERNLRWSSRMEAQLSAKKDDTVKIWWKRWLLLSIALIIKTVDIMSQDYQFPHFNRVLDTSVRFSIAIGIRFYLDGTIFCSIYSYTSRLRAWDLENIIFPPFFFWFDLSLALWNSDYLSQRSVVRFPPRTIVHVTWYI